MRKKMTPYPFIKIGIVDDHKSFAQALRYSLTVQNEFTVVFTLYEGHHLLQELYRHQIDVLLLDIKMKGEDGFTLLKKVKKTFPAVKVIMVSHHLSHPVILKCYQYGANSYFSKTSELDELKTAIQKVYQNRLYLTEIASHAMYENSMKTMDYQDLINCGISFTDTEKKIILLASRGYENKKMAEELSLKPQTLFTYRKRLIKKTRCKNMTELVAFAMDHNIIIRG